MEPVSDDFLRALRLAHKVRVRIDAYRRDVNGNSVNIGPDLAVDEESGGTVTVDGTSPIRRSLSVGLVPSASLWDTLAPIGTQLHVWRGIEFPAGSVEWVRLGKFVIDAQTLSYGPGGTLQVSAPDRWAYIQRARFEKPEKPTAGRVISDVMRGLMAGPIPDMSYEMVRNLATGTETIRRGTVFERDRDEVIRDLGVSIGAEAFLAPDGIGVIRDVPELSDAPVWLVDASQSGVLIAADRERNRQKTRNVVVVSSELADGTVPFTPVIVADEDPNSPTRVSGGFGRVPQFYSSPLLRNTTQATRAGKKILSRVRGLAAQLSLEAAVNPALDAGDVIDVLLPPTPATGGKRRVERHLIETLTVPLTPGGTQSIQTRSTRPDDVTD